MDSIKPLRKKGILSHRVGDEWILYDTERGAVHVINSTAEFVWRLCDGSRTLSDIEEYVRDTVHIPQGDTVRKNLDDIIQIFAHLGILNYKGA